MESNCTSIPFQEDFTVISPLTQRPDIQVVIVDEDHDSRIILTFAVNSNIPPERVRAYSSFKELEQDLDKGILDPNSVKAWLIDYELGPVNGFQVIAHIRHRLSDNKQTKFFIVTSHSSGYQKIRDSIKSLHPSNKPVVLEKMELATRIPEIIDSLQGVSKKARL